MPCLSNTQLQLDDGARRESGPKPVQQTEQEDMTSLGAGVHEREAAQSAPATPRECAPGGQSHTRLSEKEITAIAGRRAICWASRRKTFRQFVQLLSVTVLCLTWVQDSMQSETEMVLEANTARRTLGGLQPSQNVTEDVKARVIDYLLLASLIHSAVCIPCLHSH